MQKNSLSAKVALITGGARRVGAEIARTLHAVGMHIILHYNLSEDDALNLCEEFNHVRPNSAIALHADLLEPEIYKPFMEKVEKCFGQLDVLVNNASRFYRTPIGKATEYAWEDLMNSNLKAPFFLSQAAIPLLKKTKGTIVNIVDIHAERPLRHYSVYCLSKAGLHQMTKVLAKELGPEIRVNAVSPGAIMWPEGENALTDADKEEIVKRTALLRAGSAEDIAKAVLFFVRDAEYITGQVLHVDGGRSLCE